jgi:hypothetical protein
MGPGPAIMLAHGFTNEMLDALVRDGLATAERAAMRAGRRRIEVTWLASPPAERAGREHRIASLASCRAWLNIGEADLRAAAARLGQNQHFNGAQSAASEPQNSTPVGR